MKEEMKIVRRKLSLIGIAHALLIMFVPPLFHESWIKLGSPKDWVVCLVISVSINMLALIIALCDTPEYIKFRYVMLPCITKLATTVLLFVTSIYIQYLSIFVSEGGGVFGSDLSRIWYGVLLIVDFIANLIIPILFCFLYKIFKIFKK